jgi:hypothetical protein
VCNVLSPLDEVADSVVERHVVRWVLRRSPQHRDEVELALVFRGGNGGIVVVPCPNLVNLKSSKHVVVYWCLTGRYHWSRSSRLVLSR